MGYTRDRFGIEFNATKRDRGEKHLLRWTLLGASVLAAVSFVSARGCAKRVHVLDFPPPEKPQVSVSKAENTPKAVPPRAEPQKSSTGASAAVRTVERWIAESGGRPALERTLLEKLLAAERAANVALATDTIERLRKSPAMADLDEPLARRLGALNIQMLMSGFSTPWTATATARNGDSPYRVAREHGTTVSAVLKLNRLPPDTRKLDPGTVLRVLEFPRAALVVHRKTKQADLTLNGKFFRRYYASTGTNTVLASVQVTREAGPRTRFGEMGIVFAPGDLDEISMFLPPGASIAVTDP